MKKKSSLWIKGLIEVQSGTLCVQKIWYFYSDFIPRRVPTLLQPSVRTKPEKGKESGIR